MPHFRDMTRIGVIADTHGGTEELERCIAKAGEVAGWFHLGDFVSDAKLLAERTGLPVYSVLGNCDSFGFVELEENVFPEPQKRIASERVVLVERARIFLCHGHRYDVEWGSMQLSYRAEELGCAAALYGHTHAAELSPYGGVIKLNPGSPKRPRGACRKPSFAVLEINGSDVNASVITI